MSFILQNWSRSSISYNQDSLAAYHYVHPTDTKIEITAADYFISQQRILKINDLIIIKSVDGVDVLIVETLTPEVTTSVAIASLDENSNLILESIRLKNLNGGGHIVISQTGMNPLVVDEDGFVIVNGQMGIGTAVPLPGALVDFTSTDSFPLLPRMTTAQRDAVSPVNDGSIFYNTTTGKFNGREAGTWKEFTLV